MRLKQYSLLLALLFGCVLDVAAQRGGGGFGGFGNNFGGRGNTGGRGNNNSGPITPRIVVVGDERTNSLIISAPDEVIEMIRQLIPLVDVNVDDVTELRVFKLQNANPNDIVTQLATLFPDDTRSNSNNPFAPGAFFGGRGGRGNNNNTSGRALRLTRVMSVADPRTSSVIVSASKTIMIERLDTDSSRKPKAVVFDLKNADPLEVELVLQNMFQTTTTANRRTGGNNTTALGSRQQGTNRGLGATRQTGGGNTGGFGGLGGN